MKKITIVMELLKEKGIECEVKTVNKNGTLCTGIIVGNNECSPVIYMEKFEDYSIEDTVKAILDTYEKGKVNQKDFDVKRLTSWEYIRDNLQLCIQKKTDDDTILKREFNDLEMYIRVKANVNGSDGTYTLKKNILKGITEEEVFDLAFASMKENLVVKPMTSVLFGMPVENTNYKEWFDTGYIVMTNKDANYGASSILDTSRLMEIANAIEGNLVIIPSSIHECLIYPYDGSVEIEEFNKMVNEVNTSEVDDVEVLSNHVYLFDRKTGMITM